MPQGVYNLTRILTLPTNTVLRGDGEGLTVLRWNRTSWQGTLLQGGGFGVESLSIELDYLDIIQNNIQNGYGSVTGISKTGSNYAWVKNVSFITGSYFLPNISYNTISLNGAENFELDNVYIENSVNAVTIGGYSNFTRWSNTRVNFRGQSVTVRCGHSHVFEGGVRNLKGNASINNWALGTQPGFLVGEYCSQSSTRDLYYGGNTDTSDLKLWNDNSVADGKEGTVLIAGLQLITLFDYCLGWYYGRVNSVSGTHMVMNDTIRVAVFSSPSAPSTNTTNYAYTVGSIVIIVGGRGTGQYRFLKSTAFDPVNAPIEIDLPWDIEPDGTSYIAVTKFKGRVLMVSNNFSSEGIHMVGWFASTEVHYCDDTMGADFWNTQPISGFTSTSNQTILSYTAGFRYADGAFPGFHSGSWYNQVLGNQMQGKYGVSIQFLISVPAFNWSMTLSFGNVLRNNFNVGSSPISFSLANYAGPGVIESNAGVVTVQFSLVNTFLVIHNNSGVGGGSTVNKCGSGNTFESCSLASPAQTNLTAVCRAQCGTSSTVL